VVALGVAVLRELAYHDAQVTFSERDDVTEALLLDRTYKPLGVGVEVRAVRGLAQQWHPPRLADVPRISSPSGCASSCWTKACSSSKTVTWW
jgi:hypothetical protein